MIIGNHDIARDTASDDIALMITDDEDEFKTLFLFVMSTIACNSRGKRAGTGTEFHHFGTIEDDDLLIFVGR
jgi:hypothetical protein